MGDPTKLPAPSWATEIDGEARDGITWRRVASVKPLVNDDVVGQVRSEMEVVVEREDTIERVGDGFALVEGQALVFAGDNWFDLVQAWRLYEALGELLLLADPDGWGGVQDEDHEEHHEPELAAAMLGHARMQDRRLQAAAWACGQLKELADHPEAGGRDAALKRLAVDLEHAVAGDEHDVALLEDDRQARLVDAVLKGRRP